MVDVGFDLVFVASLFRSRFLCVHPAAIHCCVGLSTGLHALSLFVSRSVCRVLPCRPWSSRTDDFVQEDGAVGIPEEEGIVVPACLCVCVYLPLHLSVSSSVFLSWFLVLSLPVCLLDYVCRMILWKMMWLLESQKKKAYSRFAIS